MTTITLSRCERSWRGHIAKDAVGCMLGFYVLRLKFDHHGQEQLDRDLVVAETTFTPSHEVSLDLHLEQGA